MHKDLFNYTYVDNHSPQSLFLLHGTGGGENDFLFLDGLLHNKYNLIGLRGNIEEDGMNRYFKRFSHGIFDQQSIREEAEKLRRFIEDWYKKSGVRKDKTVFLGYSNGANMLLATLLYYPQLFHSLVLLHPMLPFIPKEDNFTLDTHKIFLSYGVMDPLIPEVESIDVANVLVSRNAYVTIKEYNTGHEISPEEMKDIVEFLS